MEFQNALRINPRSLDVAVSLAELKRSQSKFDEAIAYYIAAHKIGPLSYQIAYGLGAFGEEPPGRGALTAALRPPRSNDPGRARGVRLDPGSCVHDRSGSGDD